MTNKINMLAIDLAKGSFQVCAVGRRGRFYTIEVCRGHGWPRFSPRSRRASWRWKLALCRTIGAGWHNGTVTRCGLSRRPA